VENMVFISIIVIALLIILLGSRLWIGFSLSILGFIILKYFTQSPAGLILANLGWNKMNQSSMMALPLFIFMGELLFRSNISENLFKGLDPWTENLPGGLLNVNILGCAFFAAVSGSSAATTATVGKITVPELKKRNYPEKLALGTLAGSGTLGFLIPPSLMFLTYGLMASVSVGKLFIAGIIPGIMIALIFMIYTAIAMTRFQSISGAKVSKTNYKWSDRIKGIALISPVIILITMVLGSIYAGWATPTESAAVGSFACLIYLFLSKSFNYELFKEVLRGSVKTTSMVMLILWGASLLSVSLGYLRIPRMLSQYIIGLGLSKYVFLLCLTILYVFLGCLVDGFSMIVMTLPLVLPMVKSFGIDTVWFGVYLIITIEIAQITPPIGFNLFIIQGLTEKSIFDIAKYAFPFFILLLFSVVLITIFPNIALFLPRLMAG